MAKIRSYKVKVEPTEIICHIAQISNHLKKKFLYKCLFNNLTHHRFAGIVVTKIATNLCPIIILLNLVGEY